MFDALIVRPIFNLLEFIYAVIPGHDLGVAIILFTILVRLALWPLVRKQLHHAQAMRKLQPELKKIKKAASGDRKKEARLQMELYKERDIKPFSSIGTLIIQIPIFIGLYQAVLKMINDPSSLQNFSYDFIRDLPWINDIAADISKFDESLFGIVDLTRRGFESGEGGAVIYLPAIIVALASTIMQYYQTKMLMVNNVDARKLSVILRETAEGKQADQAEITAAISKLMLYFLPFATFIFANVVPSALALYLFTSSAVGYLQQRRVFNQDIEELHEIAEEPESKDKKTVAATKKSKKKKTSKSKTATKKRRKK